MGGDGTSNHLNAAKRCDRRRGVEILTKKGSEFSLPYSVAAHRAIIALRCAKNQHPFNMVKDKYYLMEVEMLQPGTVVPHPTTVSLDIKDLYKALAVDVREYFIVSHHP
ncbi:hypothetical protein BDN67DRAFT_912737 [Paxillus ammoniavirescens]|nr:hypothetical protein BDN67DRAFT_912737 [Paxillus ammoniavirescens]